MSIWVILLLVLAAAVALFLIYGYSIPAKWRVEAAIVVASPAPALFDYLQQIRNWEEWTIWNKESNSEFEFRYEGPIQGPGATQNWKTKRWSGRTQIRATNPPTEIRFFFVFGQPHHPIECTLELRPRGQETEVVWTASGDSGNMPSRRIMARMFQPYMKKDFERSLERLRKLKSA